MKIFNLLLALGLQVLTINAFAMGSRLITEGDITVTKAFVAKDTENKNQRATGKKAVFPVGTFKFSVSSSSREQPRPSCIPLVSCGYKDPVYVPYLSLTASKYDKKLQQYVAIASTEFVASGTSLKDGTYAYYGKNTKQPFNIFIKESSYDKKENYTSEKEECEVELYRRSGGYYYGGGTTYGIGKQVVRRHDDVTITNVQAKITDAVTNQVIATFKGSREFRRSEIDSTGECILNANSQND
jgi:hypothetical protein